MALPTTMIVAVVVISLLVALVATETDVSGSDDLSDGASRARARR
jgi:hypothetical protein